MGGAHVCLPARWTKSACRPADSPTLSRPRIFMGGNPSCTMDGKPGAVSERLEPMR
jgi:hypothetical protein